MTIKQFIFMGLFSSLLSIFGCKNADTNMIAKQINISELKSELELLEQGKTQFDFIGITSNGIDCIYFVKENKKYSIEFEAMDEKQLEMIPKLENFARKNKFDVKHLDYGNKPNYSSNNFAPVLRIITNADLDEIFEIGKAIQKEIFMNNASTTYDVVP